MGQKFEKLLDCEEKEVGYDDSDEENDDTKETQAVRRKDKSIENESSLAQSLKKNSLIDKKKSSKFEENALVKPKISNFMGDDSDKTILQGRNPEEKRHIKPYNGS